MRHVVLLRGINVSTSTRVAMADLREWLTAAGFDAVRTLLNTGNVVLDARGSAATVERRAGAAIATGAGFAVPVVVRSAVDLSGVLDRDLPDGESTDPSRYFVGFCRKAPSPAAAARFTSLGGDSFTTAVEGKHAFAWCPDGLVASGFGKVRPDQVLGTDCTFRNWRTVQKLAALAAD